MLNAEAQEGGAVDRWWVKDKPEAEPETKPPVQDSSAVMESEVKASDLPRDDATVSETAPCHRS